jgi:hypothetical protein
MAVIKIQTGLRLDEQVYGKLKTLSLKERRSINNLVEFVVQQYLEDYEEKNGVIPIALEE